MSATLQRSVSQLLGPLDEPGFRFTATGLDIDPGVTFEQWERYGRKLQLADKGIQWALGDWIVFGEGKFNELAAQAVEFTGLKIKTLQKYATVAKSVEKSRRRDSDQVDFSTYAEVVSLPVSEQDKILGRAARDPDYSSREVRRDAKRIKRRLNQLPDEVDQLHAPEVQTYLSHYVGVLQELEKGIPLNACFLKNMVEAHIGQAVWQKDRTVQTDFEAILEMFDEVYSATDSDIFKWLIRSGYFISDPDLDDRLETMSRHSREKHTNGCDCKPENKYLAVVKEPRRTPEQRGDTISVYTLYK